jgi:hypothetical protein
MKKICGVNEEYFEEANILSQYFYLLFIMVFTERIAFFYKMSEIY